MAIITDYIRLTKQYQQEYGAQTVVLYQVGSFYELYSAGGDDGINLKEITELLNIQMTRKNKSLIEVSETNYNMAGIPLYSLNKYLKILTNANYTAVVVDQSCDNNGPRKVVEIISPGTKLNDINPFDTNMIMVAYFDEYKSRKSKHYLMGVGVCFLDLSSGKSYIGELISTDSDPTFALDELYKFLVLYSPRELVFTSLGPLTNYTYDKLTSYLDISGSNTKCIHNKLEKYPKQMEKNAYQDQLLRKVFPDHGLLSPHEFLNLECNPNMGLAFVYMLDFCYKHNENILKNLSKPTEILGETKYCTIAFNAANQLELNHITKILNKCHTSIGRRNFRERILTPLICPDEINARYERVAEFINILSDNEASADFNKCLDNIYDVERLYRLICLQKLNPADWTQILTTIKSIRTLNKLNPQTRFAKVGSARNIYEEITATINPDIAQKYFLNNITENFFINGVYPKLDKLQAELDQSKSIFCKLAVLLHPEFFKVENTDRDGYYLQITKKRYNSIKAQLLKMGEIQIDDFKCSWADFETKSNLTTLKCSCPALDKINKNIFKTKDNLCLQITESYRELLNSVAYKYKILFSKMITYIRDIDWYYSCAKNAIENKYFRPKILAQEGSDNSYLCAKNLRHPLIEQILKYEEYVPNDIEIGNGVRGVLLYGVNSAGKSSLSKATAISIIMAQVGMYVAAELVYWPYKEIFTRIPSGDNIMKNQSTFIVEITELGNILRRCTKNSLIIGDELASGTEQVSGISIMGASIEKLCKSESSFIFATHLHDLTKISIIRKAVNQKKLNISHLSVQYDEKDDKLIYNRKLMSGQGKTLYGLEVCRAIITDIEFMNSANLIRHEVIGESTKLCETKKSRYNSNVFVDVCAICSNKAEEVHHIKLQKFADAKGFIGTVHKNHQSNLVPICEKCHNNIHHGKITVSGYVQTTKGVILNVQRCKS